MTEDQWAELLRENAREYHEPPDIVPRDAMWETITARQSARGASVRTIRRWAVLAVAAALVLASGVVIGRWSRRTPVTVVRATTVAGTPEPYRIAATEQLVQAEALLTAFQSGTRDAGTDAKLDAWARDVLSNTRLLLDSPAGADPHRRELLEDLELVLVQIVELSPNASAHDRALVDSTLSEARVLTRLRAAIPTHQVGL